ncbi:DUF1206 domain-containing protein [Paractinoplanes durhamensis]|uniref:DUF1206 domain-containing protein n=1 Tax=Paractinoplanes durhamensis TaxID=113563 RepID=A0ABQ3Z2K6_9ACTN|nr:DUF1206 domain-containing protein [Actinoplanes durhamensis]GIE04051.1 hypothetical protein Adu01nite_54010 [Actinoplanes durhamensis]
MPTLTSHVHKAADNPWLERLTRAGLVGYGALHLLFAWLVVRIAFGTAADDGDQSGALHRLATKPFGAALIVALVIGLVAMIIWQVFEASVGHRGERGRHRVYERVVSAGRAAFYTYLAWTGIKVLRGKKKSTADTQEQASQDLMVSTGGRLTVAVIGVVVVAIGAGLAIYGLTKKFEKHLRMSGVSAHVRSLIGKLGIVGYTAKGTAYAIAGVLLVMAAVTYDPDKARGLDAALRAMAAQTYGTWLLLVTALGIAAYGLFSVVQARYRKV